MDNKTPIMAVHIGTKNDTNGNSRRGWIILNAAGDSLGFVNEGPAGMEALRSIGLGTLPMFGTLSVTPSDYRNRKKHRYTAPE